MAHILSRREAVGQMARGGGASLLARALPFGVGAAVLGWPREARAAVLLDPIPSPSAEGWIQEGSEGFTEGVPLIVNDADAVPNPAFPSPFCNLYKEITAADLGSELRLEPNVSVDAGFVTDGDKSTGVHVTINDGFREIKAALLAGLAGGLKLAVRTQVGFSPGLELGALSATFSVRRLVNGDAVIERSTGGSETIQAIDLPGSSRPGVPTIEFGTYDTSAASVSRWMTLGLPKAGVEVSFASFLLTDLQVRARANNDKIQVKAIFIPASGQTTDPAIQPVSLTLRRYADSSPFWPTLFGNPITGFTLNGVNTYALSPDEKTRTGLQAFDIKKGVWSFFTAVDTRTALSPLDYSQVLVEFRVGGQVGVQLVRMIENPLGSGNWRFSSGP